MSVFTSVETTISQSSSSILSSMGSPTRLLSIYIVDGSSLETRSLRNVTQTSTVTTRVFLTISTLQKALCDRYRRPPQSQSLLYGAYQQGLGFRRQSPKILTSRSTALSGLCRYPLTTPSDVTTTESIRLTKPYVQVLPPTS